jgi:uncharacterized LabA/DUF88 family protein
MVFIDGTNLIYGLQGARLQLTTNFVGLARQYLRGRQLVRTYLYTTPQHLERAKAVHVDTLTFDVRVVFGEGIPTGDGNVKEKGVDAQLVADLVYHAAVKNLDYALVVSADTDFVKALRRVEDFGCRTGVLGVCRDVPERLREVTDEVHILTREQLLRNKQAVELG